MVLAAVGWLEAVPFDTHQYLGDPHLLTYGECVQSMLREAHSWLRNVICLFNHAMRVAVAFSSTGSGNLWRRMTVSNHRQDAYRWCGNANWNKVDNHFSPETSVVPTPLKLQNKYFPPFVYECKVCAPNSWKWRLLLRTMSVLRSCEWFNVVCNHIQEWKISRKAK